MERQLEQMRAQMGLEKGSSTSTPPLEQGAASQNPSASQSQATPVTKENPL